MELSRRVTGSDTRRRRDGGNHNSKGGPPVASLLDHEFPVVGTDDLAREAQAETYAVHAPVVGFVGTSIRT